MTASPGPPGVVRPRAASPQPPKPKGGRRRRRLEKPPAGYLAPALAILLVLSVYPLFMLIRMTFSDVGPTNLIGTWPWVGLENLRELFAGERLGNSLRVTLQITAVIFVLNMGLGFICACVLASRGRSSSALLSIIVFVWALPPLVGGSVWKFILNRDGAANGLLSLLGLPGVGWLSDPDVAVWTVSAVSSWSSLPFAIIIFRGAILAVPPEVIEAAAIDGAGYWRTRFRIVLPMIRTTVLILGTLVFLYAFRSFDIVYVMTGGGPGQSTETLSIFAYQTAFRTFALSDGAAIGFVSMCIMLLLVIPYTISVRREEAP